MSGTAHLNRTISYAPSVDVSLIFQRVCLSNLGSTSPPVTVDALNSAVMIACIVISTAQCNLRQTRCFPSVPCIFIFYSPLSETFILVESMAKPLNKRNLP